MNFVKGVTEGIGPGAGAGDRVFKTPGQCLTRPSIHIRFIEYMIFRIYGKAPISQ